jgi:hypothetical protein
MTVEQLIEELKKQPAHYPVYLDFAGYWTPVENVQLQSGCGAAGAVVELSAGATYSR